MFKKTIITSLILVYLVIIAGAVVRMTGSGMGCPDWPKCFGYIIPPTQEGQLQFHTNFNYEKGQVIIHEKSLQVAAMDFTTEESFNPQNWTRYVKHDYAIFNPWHTWIEYINRLLGALAGVAFLAMFVLSLLRWRKPENNWANSKKPILWSFAAVVLIGFQGWLGATVVYSVLAPVRITLHMLVALLIVLLLIYLLYLVRDQKKIYTYDPTFKWAMVAALILTLIQIALGTQVRQYVDERVDMVGYAAKALWLNPATLDFYIHRSFSVAVLLLNLFLFYRNRKSGLGHTLMNWVLAVIALEIATGIMMYYLDFPFLTQPGHLILATSLFGLQSFMMMTCFKERDYSRSGDSIEEIEI